MGGNPNAIEMQEIEGQKELIASLQLPRKCNYPKGLNACDQYHKMGIQVFTSSKGDDLFMGVKLPDGWRKEATDHPMWSDLIDCNGRIRANIFYKAAFYDRDSFVNFTKRYTLNTHSCNEVKDGDTVFTFRVIDNSTGQILFESEKHTWKESAQYEQQGRDFLLKNYPDSEDINAYWD